MKLGSYNQNSQIHLGPKTCKLKINKSTTNTFCVWQFGFCVCHIQQKWCIHKDWPSLNTRKQNKHTQMILQHRKGLKSWMSVLADMKLSASFWSILSKCPTMHRWITRMPLTLWGPPWILNILTEVPSVEKRNPTKLLYCLLPCSSIISAWLSLSLHRIWCFFLNILSGV